MRKTVMGACLSALVALLATAMPGVAGASGWGSRDLTVMTRNVYLGADINRPVVAALTAQAQGKSQAEILVALANATHETRAIVDRTRFDVRSRLLAREIAATTPHVVGLQEVALWRSGPLDLSAPGKLDATTVDQDFLAMLLTQLRARGVSYRAVQVANRADVEAPSFTGSPFNGTMGGAPRDVRLTMRDVMLVREGSGEVLINESGSRTYATNLQLSVAGMPMKFDRGYQWLQVRNGKQTTWVVNTHLESASADIMLAQAKELTASLSTHWVALLCDCNSNPGDNTIAPGDSVPQRAAYDHLVKSGLVDGWTWGGTRTGGASWGLGELVNDSSANFTQRLDLVMLKPPINTWCNYPQGNACPRFTSVALSGNRTSDRDPATGLWPSDHAGVTAVLGGR